MFSSEETAFSALFRHFEFGGEREIIYLCDVKSNKSSSYADYHEDYRCCYPYTFMREDNGNYRISLRSNGKVDVNKVAQKFGGGGHKMAAGIKTTGNFKETKDDIINAIKEELTQ